MKEQSASTRVLQVLGSLFPGDYLKTVAYLNLIHGPRKFLRHALTQFYRMDHVYDVIREFKHQYAGNFSILEFGVAEGYSFTKKLYATKFLKMDDRICVHGFDTFEGMPATDDSRNRGITDPDWLPGQFRGNYDRLYAYCASRYTNFRLHQGYFEDTLTADLLQSFATSLPILIWIDCDYYTSARTVFERLIPYIPSGCVIYFDEYEFNFGSRFTGEARLVHEINQGQFGDRIELIPDHHLSLNLNRVYRFINEDAVAQYERRGVTNQQVVLRRRRNDSPFP